MTDTLTRSPRRSSLSRRRALLVVAMAAVATLAWTIVELGFGHDLFAPAIGDSPPMDIGAIHVLAASAGAGLAAWASVAGLERSTRRPRLIWTALATTAFLISLGGPLGGEGIGGVDRAILAGLHGVVALGLVPGLAATIERRHR